MTGRSRRVRTLLALLAVTLGVSFSRAAETQDAARQERLQAIARLLHERIASCWSVPLQPGATPDAVRLQLEFNSDGSLARAPTLLNPKQDPAFKALAESTLRAVNRCAPYPELTRYPDLYERWRSVTLNFQRPR